MKYVFIDTDNGGTPSNATPDTSTSKYQTSSSWPANGARWSSLNGALSDATIRGITDDVTIYCQGVAADTTRAVANSMTCANLTIEGNATGAAWDATKYRLVTATASDSHLEVYTTATITGNLEFKKLQIEANGSGATQAALYADGNPSSTNLIDSCIFRFSTAARAAVTGVAAGYRTTGDTACTWNIRNSIFYDIGGNGVSASANGIRIDGSSAVTYNVYNCTVSNISSGSGTARGFAFSANNITTVKNCAVFGTASNDLLNADTVAYCATDDTYSGTGNLTGLTWTNQFQDYVNGDFRLKTGSSLIGAGIGPSSDANVPTPDIAGVTRSGTTTDIGAAMFVSGSTATIAWLRI